ncbi:MAG: Gfo/Idh/MocA family protein [Paracoccaceae bacterium]
MARYGLIGCGMMGQEHVRNVALLDDAEIGAVFDPHEGLARTAAEMSGARIEGSLEALVARDDLDAFVIVSPNDLHVEQLTAIARGRPRPVLCEKPLFTHPSQRAALSALTGWGAPVWVAMEYRYMPAVAAMIEQARRATGGVRMLTIREHRFPFLPKIDDWNRFDARTGGTMVEKCCHFFDLMRLILEDEPVRVMASAGADVNHKDERYGGRVPDILDNGYVIVDFARGARAMLELCMFAEGSRFQEELSATGPAGKIEARVPGPGRFWPAALGPAPVAEVEISPRHPKGPKMIEVPVDPALLAAGDHNGATFYQHQRFRRVVAGDGAVEVTLEDGARAVEMGLAAQESARTGRAVEL